MKRITDEEKRQLGLLIHYYRTQYFKSSNKNSDEYKQTQFCKDICSQTQLSRLEHGEALKDQEIYEKLMTKLNIDLDKISNKDIMFFEAYIENILISQNDDNLIINYKEYIGVINKYQNIFKKNIIFTHYNYCLEFILAILHEDLSDAEYLIEDVEQNIEILPPNLLILTLQYLGTYYQMINNYNKANKFYLLSLEHMHKNGIKNSIIFIDLAYNYLILKRYFISLENLNIALSIFENSNNIYILERINRYFGILYLKNGYFDEAINFFTKAHNLIEQTSKKSLTLLNNLYLSMCHYFKKDLKKAIEIINLSEATEHSKLYKAIFDYHLNKIKQKVKFENILYNKIITLYYSGDDLEEFFESELQNEISNLSEDLKILILKDVFTQYKEEKKYKKALDHLEEYLI